MDSIFFAVLFVILNCVGMAFDIFGLSNERDPNLSGFASVALLVIAIVFSIFIWVEKRYKLDEP